MLTGFISYLRRLPGRIQQSTRPQLLRFSGAFIILAFTATMLPRAPFLLPVLLVIPVAWYLFQTRACKSGTPPPPSSRLPFQLEYFSDGTFLEQQREKYGAVFAIRPLISSITCIVDLDKGLEFLAVNDNQIVPVKPAFNDLIENGFIRAMSGETHQKYKPLLARSISQETLRQREDALRLIVRDNLACMYRSSRGSTQDGINPHTDLESMVFHAWTLLFFGVDSETPLFDQIHRTNDILDGQKSGTESSKSARRALAGFCNEIIPSIMDARSANSPSAGNNKPCFISNILDDAPSHVYDQTLMANMVYMFNSSLRDMLGLCAWIVKMLADNPEWVGHARTEILSEVNRRPSPGMSTANRIVLETLRLRQSEFLWRRTLEPIVFEGFSIPRGALIRICVRECHRDGRVFEHPETFNPDRFESRQYKRNEFCPFGAHRHACIGERLTLTMGRLLVEELSREYDLTKTGDSPTRYGTLGRHWEPGEKFRIKLHNYK